VSEAGQTKNGRGVFYRLARTIHGYLSAAASLALLFFAATGVLLNHPEWMPERGTAPPGQSFTLDQATLAQANAGGDQAAAALAEAVTARTTLRGAFTTGEIFDGEALLRFEGARGNSNAVVDLTTGRVEVEVQPADTLSMLNDLHRGKNVGAAWKLVIDIAGALAIALSLIGFVIFFSMRFRLLTSLALVGAGAAAMVAVFFLFVP
jgi:uncharacterized protein